MHVFVYSIYLFNYKFTILQVGTSFLQSGRLVLRKGMSYRRTSLMGGHVFERACLNGGYVRSIKFIGLCFAHVISPFFGFMQYLKLIFFPSKK